MRVAAQPDSLTRSNASRPAGPAASTNSRAAFTTRALESPSNLAAESSEPLRAGRLGCGASGWSWCSVIEADIADGNREEGVTIASGTAPTSVPSRATQAARFMANRICAASRHRMQRCHRSDAGAMRRRSNVARRSASRARSRRTRRCHRPRCASLRPSKKICTHRREIRQRSPRIERESPRETEAPAASPPSPRPQLPPARLRDPQPTLPDALLHPGFGQLWFPPQLAPRWRNWQTHQLEVLAPFTGHAGSIPVLGTTPRRCARRSERG